MMKIDLKHKKALVGGSTQGLGKAIALQLAECGASVTLLARNEDKLKATLKELNVDFGQQHQYIVVDFLNFNDFSAKTTKYFKHNSVDILVNNTNGPSAGTALDKTMQDYQLAFDLLFKTQCHLTLLALPAMKKNGFGRIINTASLSVKEPIAHLVLSNTIRAAVTNWAKTLATDIAKDGITVNNILTGIFDTERIQQLNAVQATTKGVSIEENLNETINSIPMKRLGKPSEFGYLVAFLASEYSSYITGTNIPIDGGIIKSL
jgi:3-oxoacyl-[acyl-carrier protein] reductase